MALSKLAITLMLSALMLMFLSLGAVFSPQSKSSELAGAEANENKLRHTSSEERMLPKGSTGGGGGGSGGGGKPGPSPTTRAPTNAPTDAPTGAPTTCGAAIDPLPPLPGKKGAAFTLRDPATSTGGTWDQNMPKVIKANVKWNYSWGNKIAPNQPADIEFVPMIWGFYGETNLRNGIENNILPEVQAGRVKRVLAYNEPDNVDQSNIPVDTVISSWPILEEYNLPLGAPSVTHINATWHRDWVAKADEQCLRYEYNAVHWYGGASASSFKTRMQYAYSMAAPRPLLITEFAPADWTATSPATNKFTQTQVLNFMKEVLPWMEAQDWIAGYAWFSFQQSSNAGTSSALFVDGTSDLTPLGQFYASVTPGNPSGNQTITV